MKKILIPLVCLFLAANLSNAQTVLFKPGPVVGEDALLMTTYDCTPNGYPSPIEIINMGNNPELDYIDWTYNAGGCPHGTTRSLIRFTELNTLPPGITILSATLRLYGVPTSGNWGNSSWPGSPYGTTNPGWVSRVTSGWAENTVDYSTQPSTTTTNQAAIGISTSQFGWNTSIDVLALVNDIRASGVNDGFMLTLQTEAIYRSILMASSDHADPDLWPELEITYCQPDFTYCSSSLNPFKYEFTAMASGMLYDWTIDGNSVASTQNFIYDFGGSGNHKVCLRVYSDRFEEACERCINLCIDDNEVIDKGDDDQQGGNGKQKLSPSTDNAQVWKQLKADGALFTIQSATPNPTSKTWDVSINVAIEGEAEITLTDIAGKTITNEQKQFTKGINQMVVGSENLPQGIYFLEVKNKHFTTTHKLVKQ